MNIIFVLPDMRGGGSEKVVSLLANEYCKRGYKITILLFGGNTVAYPLHPNVSVVSVSMETKGNPFTALQRIYRMRKFYAKHKGAYIFSFCVMGTVYSALTKVGFHCRMLVSERTDPREFRHIWLRNLAYDCCGRIICQTTDMIPCFPKRMESKCVVIPNPLSLHDVPIATGPRIPAICSVGRLVEVKNHPLLFQAFASFSQKHPDYSLHLYGEGHLEDALKELSYTLNIENKVQFHGFTQNVFEEIMNHSMYVSTSNYEGLSNSLIEANSIGIPVIATDCPIGGSKYCIDNKVNGLLIPVNDVQALVIAMETIANNPQLAQSLSQNGIARRERYNLETIATLFLKEAGL
ncbi:MAG: glycosyltransferase [Eubacteriales bacterium]